MRISLIRYCQASKVEDLPPLEGEEGEKKEERAGRGKREGRGQGVLVRQCYANKRYWIRFGWCVSTGGKRGGKRKG
jgi:hypothetical protein